MNKNVWISGILGLGLTFATAALAQAPVLNIDAKGHPDLADAQLAIIKAYEKTEIAQRANRDKLGGHAESAKQLLAKAAEELKRAEETADGKIPPRR